VVPAVDVVVRRPTVADSVPSRAPRLPSKEVVFLVVPEPTIVYGPDI
jgi:hypothetical protein